MCHHCLRVRCRRNKDHTFAHTMTTQSRGSEFVAYSQGESKVFLCVTRRVRDNILNTAKIPASNPMIRVGMEAQLHKKRLHGYVARRQIAGALFWYLTKV